MGWLNLTMANQTVKNGLKAKKITLPQFFILQNFKKILRANPWVMMMRHFRVQNNPYVLNTFFKVQTIVIYLLALWIGQHSSCGSRVMWMRNFWAQNGPYENFFRKPVNEPCFFHSCLSTCQKSKSDINLLVKYWRLKNTEISLAESHFWL